MTRQQDNLTQRSTQQHLYGLGPMPRAKVVNAQFGRFLAVVTPLAVATPECFKVATTTAAFTSTSSATA